MYFYGIKVSCETLKRRLVEILGLMAVPEKNKLLCSSCCWLVRVVAVESGDSDESQVERELKSYRSIIEP